MGRGMRKRKPIFSAKELGLLSGEESDEESEDSFEQHDDASDNDDDMSEDSDADDGVGGWD